MNRLVRSTPVQQNGAPCPPSRSSLDYRVSIDDSLEMKIATGIRVSQPSWDQNIPHDRIRLCRELRDEAGRKLMMKRLEMFVPTSWRDGWRAITWEDFWADIFTLDAQRLA